MKPIFFSLLSLALSLVTARAAETAAASGAATGTARGPALISQVCEKAAFKDLCLSSLNDDPNTKDADLSALTLISVRIATSNGTATSTYIRQMLRDEELDPAVEQCLSDCSDDYLDAVDQLDDSLAALTVRNYGDLEKWIQTAADDAYACEGCFKEAVPEKAILSERNDKFFKLCDNALSIAKLLDAAKQ